MSVILDYFPEKVRDGHQIFERDTDIVDIISGIAFGVDTGNYGRRIISSKKNDKRKANRLAIQKIQNLGNTLKRNGNPMWKGAIYATAVYKRNAATLYRTVILPCK